MPTADKDFLKVVLFCLVAVKLAASASKERGYSVFVTKLQTKQNVAKLQLHFDFPLHQPFLQACGFRLRGGGRVPHWGGGGGLSDLFLAPLV